VCAFVVVLWKGCKEANVTFGGVDAGQILDCRNSNLAKKLNLLL
jgi:hypothetical protein